MTCTMVLDAMLEADLDELRVDADTPLSLHLRTCARCRAVAGRLAVDTDALARLVTTVRVEPHEQHRRRTRVRAWRLQAAAVAVAAGVVIVLRVPRPASAPAGAPASPSPLVMQPVRVTPSISAPARRTHPAIRTARPAPHRDLGPAIFAATVEVAATPAIRAERAVAIAPVRLEVEPRSSLGDGVAVDPPPGRRATIIPTDQPGVTVVWLHR